MVWLAVRGDLPHVGIDVNPPRLRSLAQRPMHGVALVEAGAEDEQELKLRIEQRRGRMPGAGIAEHAERELWSSGKTPFARKVVATGIDQRSAAALNSPAAESCSTPAPARIAMRFVPASRSKACTAACWLSGSTRVKKSETGTYSAAQSAMSVSWVRDRCTGPLGCDSMAVRPWRSQ